MFRSKLSALVILVVLLKASFPGLLAQERSLSQSADSDSPSDFSGKWQLCLSDDQVAIRCGLELKRVDGRWTAALINGAERIPVDVEVGEDTLELKIPHYDSTIRLSMDGADGGMQGTGTWRKRRGPDEWVQMDARVTRERERESDPIAAQRFAGRWEVQFSKSSDPAVGIFRVTDGGRVEGTFLTTTGDYRFLAGTAVGGRMSLSCFDGAHAFSFESQLRENGDIEGDFRSANTWHETFTATRNERAALPDSFRQTLVNQNVRLADFEFPDVNGKPVNLDSDRFRGKPRVVYVFGSWCPNCHDAAAYLSTLEKTYADQGLSILGLAFELTGDFTRDARQVKRYLARHQCSYPVLIAGTADKAKASKTFPLLDRVRSYPTTIFIDRSGKITAVHTGFSGPATGEAYEQLKLKFTNEIESILKN